MSCGKVPPYAEGRATQRLFNNRRQQGAHSREIVKVLSVFYQHLQEERIQRNCNQKTTIDYVFNSKPNTYWTVGPNEFKL